MNSEKSNKTQMLTLCVLLSSNVVNAKGEDKKFKLPPLPYAENALAPYISERTIQFHYGKHLLAYVNNTNNLKAGTEFDDMNLADIVKKSTGGLFNNAAQVFNHVFYFEALQAYAADKVVPKEKIKELIDKNFGSFDAFKEKFTQAGTTLFGSGWVWLIIDKDEKLEIMQTGNADTPIKYDKKPLLTMDVWEHAYYLDTQNARPKYIENFWNVINWEAVEKRLNCNCSK